MLPQIHHPHIHLKLLSQGQVSTYKLNHWDAYFFSSLSLSRFVIVSLF
jgi:hypothetical protein